MKVLAVLIMLAALFLLYRIAYPGGKAKDSDPPPEKPEPAADVMGKSRYVLPDRSKPLQTPASSAENETNERKAITFAAGSEKRDAVIPPGKPDEVFGEEPDPESLDIEPDENETESDSEEEVECLRQTPGGDAETAEGLTIEEMAGTVEAVQNPADESAELLYRMERTDMFERLVSGDEGKAERIRAVIDRYIRSLNPEVEVEEDAGNDSRKDFDIRDFLS